jgi:pimeloyl-ACP methyl ester carboxylesterase
MSHKNNKVWVLLRGLGRESAHWNDFPKVLQSRFPNDKIRPLDLPGAGEYRNVKPPLKISEYVDFLRNELFSHDEERAEICLFAVSLGGMVALEWMKRFPGEVKTGILVNTSLGNSSRFYNRLRWQIYPRFFFKVAGSKGMKREKALLPLLSEFYSKHEALVQSWSQISKERPMKGEYVLRQLWAASRFKIKQKVQPPTLLISSLKDRLVSPKCSQDIHSKFNYPIIYHDWGGHDLTTDDPEWVADRVLEWVKDQNL